MDDGECLYCDFSETLDATWSTIETAEMDGANMEEAKNLCRQANNAHEQGSEELATRYLARASRLAQETYHSHARTKTDGIIQFTIVLIRQVKQMGENVDLAEQMMEKALAAMKAGEYEGARSLATKADGYLKQMKEDSYLKLINEILPKVEAGAASDPEVAELLVKAKKLIDAREFEGAADTLELAKGKL